MRIALFNRLFAWSILTYRNGVRGVFLPWGKGLKPKSVKLTLLALQLDTSSTSLNKFVEVKFLLRSLYSQLRLTEKSCAKQPRYPPTQP